MRTPSRSRICGCVAGSSHPTPMTAQHAQTPELPRQDQARSRQAELADAGQPHAVGDIRFPALLDMLRQGDTDADIFQRRKFPADRFRRGGGHAVSHATRSRIPLSRVALGSPPSDEHNRTVAVISIL